MNCIKKPNNDHYLLITANRIDINMRDREIVITMRRKLKQRKNKWWHIF